MGATAYMCTYIYTYIFIYNIGFNTPFPLQDATLTRFAHTPPDTGTA